MKLTDCHSMLHEEAGMSGTYQANRGPLVAGICAFEKTYTQTFCQADFPSFCLLTTVDNRIKELPRCNEI